MNDPTIGKYIDYKLFEFFRDRFLPFINANRAADVQAPIYQHLFLAPEEAAMTRSFQFKGVKMPFVCIWTPTFPQLIKQNYGHSILFRDVVDADLNVSRVRLVDFEVTVNLFSASYFKNFQNHVSQDIEEMELQRYFEIDLSEILPGYVSKVELKRTSFALTPKVSEKSQERAFSSKGEFKFSMSFPLLADKSTYIDALSLYLNDHLLYEYSV